MLCLCYLLVLLLKKKLLVPQAFLNGFYHDACVFHSTFVQPPHPSHTATFYRLFSGNDLALDPLLLFPNTHFATLIKHKTKQNKYSKYTSFWGILFNDITKHEEKKVCFLVLFWSMWYVKIWEKPSSRMKLTCCRLIMMKKIRRWMKKTFLDRLKKFRRNRSTNQHVPKYQSL